MISAPAELIVAFAVLPILSNLKLPGLSVLIPSVAHPLYVRVEFGAFTLVPVKGDTVAPCTLAVVHVFINPPVVVRNSNDVPGERLAVNVTELFCVAPVMASVVAEALLAQKDAIAIAAIAKIPNCLI